MYQLWGGLTATNADPTIAGISLMFMSIYFMICGYVPLQDRGTLENFMARVATLPYVSQAPADSAAQLSIWS